ncbi:carbohydrate ABC transporter permease [Murimonas intestini]|uniref:Carbohydrate ABC transporter membrane protein 2 (CUT1 family) n=1 Tax=Murimonas intestini TaxID=1337051 RepID=A0AB73T6I8_9FIRM|nr:carbohydrate ABC transporter permease [Murimonas intestini]MCR1842197.1 carbohydrate ABC transporter permease [Murimonas intestini]MCR1864932.1 carbohydrate ABC transporter permease [Murimonas intestini]MCR1884260.1 carbohydrate ABC transporter permease [Murimonas intestini]
MVRKDTGFQIFAHVFMIILGITVVFPMALLIMSSISSEADIIKYGYTIFPKNIDFTSYKFIFGEGSIFHSYMVTVFVTIVGTVLSVIVTTMVSYILTVPGLPGKRILSFFILFTMLFSGGLVPSYMMWSNIFHIKNTIWALLLPFLLCSAFHIMITRTYFQNNIPKEVLESARIDGMSEFGIFFKIVLPLSVPIIATIGFMNALMYWNDWKNSLYFITDKNLVGVQALLNNMLTNVQYLAQSMDASSIATDMANIPTLGIRMAVAVVGMLPMIALYPFFQKYYMKGLTIGAVKG